MTFRLAAFVTAMAAAGFSQKVPEVRTFHSSDGQTLQVNALGQILGFDKPTGCPDPRSPQCFKLGLALTVRGVHVPLQPHQGGFAPDTPAHGARIDASDSLQIEVRSQARGVLPVRQTITWRPGKRVVVSRYIIDEINRKLLHRALQAEDGKPGPGGPGNAADALPIPAQLSYGCNCEPPGPIWTPLQSAASGSGRVTQSAPTKKVLAPGMVFTSVSEMEVADLASGASVQIEYRRVK